MSYWWHAPAAPAVIGPPAIAIPVTVAAVATAPTATKLGSAIAPLEASSSVIVTNLAATGLTLTWDGVVGATKYDIERNGFIVVLDWPSTQYDDTGLTPSTTYRYRVHAKP